MSANDISQDLRPDQRLTETASILAKAVSRHRREVKANQRFTSSDSTQTALAIFPKTSLSVPVPAGEDREIGDDA